MWKRRLLVGGVLPFLVFAAAGCKSKTNPVTVYCAAGLRDPMAELIPVFEKDHASVTVQVDYGGSGELLGRIKAGAPDHRPDVFIAAEESYAEQARQLGLVDRTETLGYFVPVIAVAKGNPKSVHALADLNRPDVKTVLGDPRGPAIGLVTDRILSKAGLMSVRERAAGTFATVQAVAAQVVLHNADACIIWDTIARLGDFRNALDTVAIPDAPQVRIVICRVAGCRRPDLADAFIRLAATTEAGQTAFRKYGFNVPTATTPTWPSSLPSSP